MKNFEKSHNLFTFVLAIFGVFSLAAEATARKMHKIPFFIATGIHIQSACRRGKIAAVFRITGGRF